MAEPKSCRTCGKPIVFAGQDDNGKWIIKNPDGTPHVDERRGGGGGNAPRGRSAAELHDIRREAVLNSTIAAMAAGLDMAEVISNANRFLQWVEQNRPSDFGPAPVPFMCATCNTPIKTDDGKLITSEQAKLISERFGKLLCKDHRPVRVAS